MDGPPHESVDRRLWRAVWKNKSHGVPERDDQEELGEAEEATAVLSAEHPADAVPGDQDGGEGEEEARADIDEGPFVRRQQADDGVLDGADGVVAGGWGMCVLGRRADQRRGSIVGSGSLMP